MMKNQITYVIVTVAIAAIVAGLSIIGLNQVASAQWPPSEFPGQGQGSGPPSEFPGQGQGSGPPSEFPGQGQGSGPPSEFPGQGNGPPFLRITRRTTIWISRTR